MNLFIFDWKQDNIKQCEPKLKCPLTNIGAVSALRGGVDLLFSALGLLSAAQRTASPLLTSWHCSLFSYWQGTLPERGCYKLIVQFYNLREEHQDVITCQTYTLARSTFHEKTISDL